MLLLLFFQNAWLYPADTSSLAMTGAPLPNHLPEGVLSQSSGEE